MINKFEEFYFENDGNYPVFILFLTYRVRTDTLRMIKYRSRLRSGQ